MKKLCVLGAGESGIGAAILAQKKGFEVFVKDFPQAQLSVAGIGSDMAIIKEYITQKNLNSCIKVFSISSVVKSLP